MAVESKISRLLAGVQRAVNLANNELLVKNIQIKGDSGNDSRYATFSNTAFTGIRTITVPDADVNLGHIADLATLSGVAAGEVDLGEFDGDTIPDDSTIKEALQALEDAVEGIEIPSEFSDAAFRISDDTTSTKKIAFQASGISADTVRTITMPDADVDLGDIADNAGAITDLQTLSGVAANAEDLGTFTGSIIPDSSDIKEALQALETEIESIPSPIYYAGVYNASTNTPDLDDSGARVQGALYRVSTAGTHDFGAFGGSITFKIGDRAVYNGTAWEKWDINDSDINSDDLTEGTTNLFFSDERAQDAVGAMLAVQGTTDVDLVYADGTPELKAQANSSLITGKTAKTSAVDNDELLIADSEASGALKKITKAQLFAGFEQDTESFVSNSVAGASLGSGLRALRWAVVENSETAGKLHLANSDANTGATYKDLFYVAGLMVAASEAVDAPVQIVKKGKMTVTGHGFPVGKPVFLSGEGLVSATAPSAENQAVVRVAIAVDANTLDVDIQVIGVA